MKNKNNNSNEYILPYSDKNKKKFFFKVQKNSSVKQKDLTNKKIQDKISTEEENKNLIEKNIKIKKLKLGRKRKSDNEEGTHNKFSQDNLIRKAKCIIFEIIRNYDNDIIIKTYNNILGNGINKKEIFRLNQNQVKNDDVNFNKQLLNKTQGEIFSDNISQKFSNFPSSHNKDLIQKLMNEVDEEKKNKFNKLFNKTLLQSIQHIRGSDKIEGLEGLENRLDKELSGLNEEQKYINELKNVINNYENIYNNKKARKKKTKID